MRMKAITVAAATFLLGALPLPIEAREEQVLGNCTTIVEGASLFVIGNEIANDIEIVGAERSMQVTCDGFAETFAGVDKVVVEAGVGDDINSFVLGDWTGTAELAGGGGEDTLHLVTGPRAELFDVRRGEATDAVEVQVTDLATGNILAQISGSTLEVLTVEMGDGNDQANVSQLVGTALNILGQGGDDITLTEVLAEIFPPGTSSITVVDLGGGEDELIIGSTPLEDRFDIKQAAGPDSNSVAVQVTDIATGMVTGNIVASAVERTSIKMGAGNDILDQFGGLSTILSVFGEDGDDLLNWAVVPILPFLEQNSLYDGGPGHDKCTYKGTTASEEYELAGVPDLTIPDPELRVTDIATGLQLAHIQFLHVEDIGLDTSGGDDVVDVQWDAALTSGLSLVQVDLGKGNNAMSVNLLPVLTMPETDGVQTARFDVVGGRGKDEVTFNHSAGNWFDVFFTADLGKDDDTFRAEFGPPPDDGLPGPEGLRRLQFDVAAGGENDFVAIHNRTTDELFMASLSADLAGGDDIFEGTGTIGLGLLPGPGFDTARISRNLREFVTEFEIVEILE